MSKEQDFIDSIGNDVLADAIEKKFLPSLTIAQAILESNWGVSELSSVYHNYFGIKGSGDAGTVDMPTTEYIDGVAQKTNAHFAAYSSVKAGIAAHTELFQNGVSWNPTIYHALYGVSDYKEAAHTVQECGYATDPAYADKLISIIEQYSLYEYDGKFWEALAPSPPSADWKKESLQWLQDAANINPPVGEHDVDETVTFAQLGAILSRLVRK